MLTFLKMSCKVRSARRLSRMGSAPKLVVTPFNRQTGQLLCSLLFRNPEMHILHDATQCLCYVLFCIRVLCAVNVCTTAV